MSNPSLHRLQCPYCSAPFYAGQVAVVRCPGCKQFVTIGGPTPPQPRQAGNPEPPAAHPTLHAPEPDVPETDVLIVDEDHSSPMRYHRKKVRLIGFRGAMWIAGILLAMAGGYYFLQSNSLLDLDKNHRMIVEYIRENSPDDAYPTVIRWYPPERDTTKKVLRYRLKYRRIMPLVGAAPFDDEFIVDGTKVVRYNEDRSPYLFN